MKYSLVFNCESNNGKYCWGITLPEELIESNVPGIEPVGLAASTSSML